MKEKYGYNTLAKEAIKYQIKKELQEEEMRLLYVALTRAREKLIITGIDKNLKKSLKEKEAALQISNNKVTKEIAKKCKSYLDWIENVNISDRRMKDLIEVYEHSKYENFEKSKNEENTESFEIEERPINPEIDKILTWVYPQKALTQIEGKSSVSKLAKDDIASLQVELKKPKFMEPELQLSKAEIGTTVHLVMQKLEFMKEYTMEEIENLLEKLVQKEIITKNQKEAIPKQKILNFAKSEMFKRIRKAKNIYQEKAFYINIPAKEVYGNELEENILVQGIIDLYFIDENGKIILMDYKTDYVPENKEKYLVEKYESQLSLYKRALEQALKQQVEETYIYSTYLDKVIKL